MRHTPFHARTILMLLALEAAYIILRQHSFDAPRSQNKLKTGLQMQSGQKRAIML
jgi:hypothetical protein